MKAEIRLFKITEFILGIFLIALAIILFLFSCFLLNEECYFFKNGSIILTLATFLINIFYISKLSLKLKKNDLINFVHSFRWIKFLSILFIVLSLLSFTKGYTRKDNNIIVKNYVTIKKAENNTMKFNWPKDPLKIKLGAIELKDKVAKPIIMNCNHSLNVKPFICKEKCMLNDTLINNLIKELHDLNKNSSQINTINNNDSIQNVYNININKLKLKKNKNKILEEKNKTILKKIQLD